ncbi:mechanosensitive ion channel family protein, partial [Hyella patelloides]|uniref:mechanosensitive ion channel family protein n=1 Tax=Hyella patelloides TaxID=1982969 RepID=UPI001FE93342
NTLSWDTLSNTFFENSLADYLLALAVIVASKIVVKIIRRFAITRLKKLAARTETIYDDAIIRIFERNFIPVLYLGGFFLAIQNLTLHPILGRIIEVLAIFVATFFVVKLITSLVECVIKIYWLNYHRDNSNLEQSIDALLPAIRVVIWLIGIIFLLDNLGFNISAVVASLGIGGVAVALASQGVLQDLFSYFSILLDRPFELGDFIIVGDYLGTVEYVGIKTTRLRSIDGEEIIIANTDLTSSRIRNYKRMQQRRVVFKFGVLYETNSEQLAKIPVLIENIINDTENATYDRAHFSGYGAYSLDFEIVYFIESNDYTIYMDAQQKINFKVKSEFAKHHIEFAYPTQVNYLNNLETNQNNGNGNKAVEIPL